jgi:hypothetical protein
LAETWLSYDLGVIKQCLAESEYFRFSQLFDVAQFFQSCSKETIWEFLAASWPNLVSVTTRRKKLPPLAPAAVETAAAPAPVAISAVDVVAKMEALAGAHAEKLNWKTSIVDLLKLLGLDSSLAVRKELAAELGCPAEKMGDSAQMNMWLHKTVLQKLAANGGNIPADLL